MARDEGGADAEFALTVDAKFNFCRPSAVPRRRRLLKESVDAIIRDGDVNRLMSHIGDVQHADIEPGEVGYGALHKGLHVMQYASQYLVYTQGVLRDKESALRERERELKEQVERIRRTHGIQREHCKRLHKGDRHLDELLDQHHAMLRSVNPALARRCVLHEDGVLEVVPVPQSGRRRRRRQRQRPQPQREALPQPVDARKEEEEEEEQKPEEQEAEEEEVEETKNAPPALEVPAVEEAEEAPPVPVHPVAEVETQTTPKGEAGAGWDSPRRRAPTKYRGPAPPDEPPPPDALYRPPGERPVAHRRGYEAPPPSLRVPGSEGAGTVGAKACAKRSPAPLANTVRRGDEGSEGGVGGAEADGEVAIAGGGEGEGGGEWTGASRGGARPSAALLGTGHSVSWVDTRGGELVEGEAVRDTSSARTAAEGEGASGDAGDRRDVQLRPAAAVSASGGGSGAAEWEEGDDVLLGTAQSAAETGPRGARRSQRPFSDLTPPLPQYDASPAAASTGESTGRGRRRPASAATARSATGRSFARKPYRELSDEEEEEEQEEATGVADREDRRPHTAGSTRADDDGAAAAAAAEAALQPEKHAEERPSPEQGMDEEGAGAGAESESDYEDEGFEESEAAAEEEEEEGGRGNTPVQAFASPLGPAADSPARRGLRSAGGTRSQTGGRGGGDWERARASEGAASLPEPVSSPRGPRAEATASSEELFWRSSAETVAAGLPVQRSADDERGPVRQAIAAAAAAAAEESAEGSASLLSPPPTHAPDTSAEEARSGGEGGAVRATPPRIAPPPARGAGPRSGPSSGRASGRRRSGHGETSSAKGSQGGNDSLLDSSLLTEGRLVGEEGTSLAEEDEADSAVLSASQTSPEPSPAADRARGSITHMDSPSPEASRPRSTHSATGLRMSPRRLVEGLDDPSTPLSARDRDEVGEQDQEEDLTPRPGRLPPRPSSSSRLSGATFANGAPFESEHREGAGAGHSAGTAGRPGAVHSGAGMAAAPGSPRQQELDPGEALCVRVSQIRLAERARVERPSRLRVVYRLLGRVWVSTPWTDAPAGGTVSLTHASTLDLSEHSLALGAVRAAFEADDDRRSLPASDVEDPGDEARPADRGGGWEEPNIVFRVLRDGGAGGAEETVGASRLSLHTLLDEGRDLTHHGLRLVSPAGQPMGTLVCSVEGADALARAL